jgi:hypothetical protein
MLMSSAFTLVLKQISLLRRNDKKNENKHF